MVYKKKFVFSLFVLFLFLFGKNAYAESLYLYDVFYDSNTKSITLKTSRGVKTDSIKVDNPPRTVIDLESTVFSSVSKKIDVNDGFIKQIRVAQYQASPPISRISIDTDKHIEFDTRIEENRNGLNIVYTPTEFEKSNISINNNIIKKYAKKKKLNDVEALEYSGNKLIISAKSKINYKIDKIDNTTYSIKLLDFTMSGINEIPVKTNHDIKDIKIREKDDNSEFTFKVKPGVKLAAKLNESNEIEFYTNSIADENINFNTLPSDLTTDTSHTNSNNNFVSLDFVEKDLNSKIYISSSTKSLNYKMFKLNNPDRLVIDTFGTNVKDFIDPLLDKYSKNILRSRIGVIEKSGNQPEGIRIVFEMKNGVDIEEKLQNDKTLEITFKSLNNDFYSQQKPVFASNVKKRFVIALDPGHGGKDPGAIGKAGYREKDVTLAVTYYLRQMLLDNGLAVLMARSDDSEILLQPRVDIANNNGADLFVSIHCNSMEGNTVRGIETYYRTPQSTTFAQTVHKSMIENLGALDRGTRVRNFFVIRKTTMPSVLLEIGYLSNPGEEQLLATVSYQKKVAASIYKGIKEYLGSQGKI